MGWQLGIDAVMAVRGTSTVTLIRDGRFVETRHITDLMALTDWPRIVREIVSDLVGPVEIRVDDRGIGGAVYDVLRDAGISARTTLADSAILTSDRRKMRGLV